MTERTLAVSLGKKDPAIITRTWRGTFTQLVEQLLRDVRDTRDKAAAGWICGAAFNPEYRHGDNFQERNLLSLDYDHIKPEDVGPILAAFKGAAFLAHTTWSHAIDAPRIRVWVPLSRAASAEEFQAVSRKVAEGAGIELAARESHTVAQFMYRPASQTGVPFQHWEDTTAPYLDVDEVLAEYWDPADRTEWPKAKGEELHNFQGKAESPLTKPGVVGLFCRAFTISDAIERFGLPYDKVR